MAENICSTLGQRKQGGYFQFSVLTCKENLSATKTIKADGAEIPFGRAKHFKFKYCEIDGLEEFARALDWLSNQPRMFIIRGQLVEGLAWWQRRLLYPKDGEPATIECPARRWLPLDFDGVTVPSGLGAPDKLADAGYFIRDTMLPSAFRGVQAVAAATSSTGRKGPGVARLRLFFGLAEAADNDALWRWCDGLSQSAPALCLDPSVMLAMQPIYTARPVFDGCTDPVPPWARVAVLDGVEEAVALDVPKAARHRARTAPSLVVQGDVPEWLAEMAAADTGRGVVVVDTSSKGWAGVRRAFTLLDCCGQGRRHMVLNKVAWELAHLSAEGEIEPGLAREAFIEAASNINNSDGKYDAALVQRHIDDAFADCRR
jgi:hypothetical protein